MARSVIAIPEPKLEKAGPDLWLRHLERALAGRRPAIWRRGLRELKKLGEHAARAAMPHRTAAARASQ